MNCKNIRILFVITLITLLCNQVNAGWKNIGSYLELQAGNGGITQVLAPKNDTDFSVVIGNNIFKKFNYNGDSLYQKVINPGDYTFLRVSDDARSYNLYYDNFGYYPTLFNTITTKNLETDSIIFSKEIDSVSAPQPLSAYIGNKFADYNSEIKLALLFCNTSTYGQHMFIIWATVQGAFSLYNPIKDTFRVISNAATSILAYDKVYKHLIGTFDSENWNSSMTNDEKEGQIDKQLVYFNFNNNRSYLISRNYISYSYPNQGINGYMPEFIRLKNTDSSFITGLNTNIYFYSYRNDSIILSSTMDLKYIPIDIIFSKDDNYLIVATPNNTVEIYYVNTKSKIKSYQLKDSTNVNNLVLTQDGKGFLASNARGAIKYFTPEYFSDTLKALFASDVQLTYPNKNITFFSLSTGFPDSYFWDFGDGLTSNQQNPVHSYLNAGKYSIKLIVTKGAKTDSIIINGYITIKSDFKADFSAGILTGDYPLSVQFIDKSNGNVISRKWYFFDADTSTAINPLHIYKKPGIYPVSLIVSDGNYFDTLTKIDYIKVNQSVINDTIIETEKFNWTFNDSISGVKGFEDIKGGYLAEIVSGNKNYIYKFNTNFDTLWTRYLYPSKFHCNIQQVYNGTTYVIGNQTPDYSKFYVNKLNSSGDIKFANKFVISGYTKYFEYIAYDDGYTIATNYTTGLGTTQVWDNISIVKMNTSDSAIQQKYILNVSLGNINYYYSLKFAFDKTFGCYIYAKSYQYRTDSKSTWFGNHICYINNKDIYESNTTCGSENNFVNITSFCLIDSCNFITIEDEKYIRKIYKSNDLTKYTGRTIWTDSLPKTILKSLLILNNNRFVISGSKNGNCWFAIFDTSGAIIEEHTLDNRFGSFDCISKNKDGSFLLVGTLYKNSAGSVPVMITQKENISSNGLYIMKTKPIKFTDVNETLNSDFKFEIYPNPSTDFIVFKGTLPEISYYSLIIFDIFGNRIEVLNDNNFTTNNEIRLNTNKFTSGIYFYQLTVGKNITSGKFEVIK